MKNLASLSRIAMAALCLSVLVAEPASAQHWRRAVQNTAVVSQQGPANGAGIVQNGQGNDAGVYQFGANNSGTIQQTGNDNAACLIQFGRNNDATIVQTGDGNDVGVVQARGDTRIVSSRVCSRGVLGLRLRR